MIKSVNVSAMKSIKEMKIDCKELNLFVGTNSSGKSTFLQALLLLKQHKLNGRYISLGDFREVRNYSLPKKPFLWREVFDFLAFYCKKTMVSWS